MGNHVLERLWGYLVGGLEIFPYIRNNNSNWLIFFRGVETTNQVIVCFYFQLLFLHDLYFADSSFWFGAPNFQDSPRIRWFNASLPRGGGFKVPFWWTSSLVWWSWRMVRWWAWPLRVWWMRVAMRPKSLNLCPGQPGQLPILPKRYLFVWCFSPCCPCLFQSLKWRWRGGTIQKWDGWYPPNDCVGWVGTISRMMCPMCPWILYDILMTTSVRISLNMKTSKTPIPEKKCPSVNPTAEKTYSKRTRIVHAFPSNHSDDPRFVWRFSRWSFFSIGWQSVAVAAMDAAGACVVLWRTPGDGLKLRRHAPTKLVNQPVCFLHLRTIFCNPQTIVASARRKPRDQANPNSNVGSAWISYARKWKLKMLPRPTPQQSHPNPM